MIRIEKNEKEKYVSFQNAYEILKADRDSSDIACDLISWLPSITTFEVIGTNIVDVVLTPGDNIRIKDDLLLVDKINIMWDMGV